MLNLNRIGTVARVVQRVLAQLSGVSRGSAACAKWGRYARLNAGASLGESLDRPIAGSRITAARLLHCSARARTKVDQPLAPTRRL